MEALEGYLASRGRVIDRAIDEQLPRPAIEPKVVHQCMRYAVEGGKRLRPILALSVGEMMGCPAAKLLPTCVALELIHTHSLILDDMPCMDNDDYRRGRPASHKLFGEGIALLAADALLNLAIAILGSNHSRAGIAPATALDVIREVGEAVGTGGVIGGQAADLAFSGAEGGSAILEMIHMAKTANLFRLSARAAALVAGAQPREMEAVTAYSEGLGLAFQIVDDLLDYLGSESPGRGREREEPSYAASFGVEKAQSLAREATEDAVAALSIFGDEAATLRLLAAHNLDRA